MSPCTSIDVDLWTYSSIITTLCCY